MKHITLLLILFLGSASVDASSHSKDKNHLKKDCEEMLAGIVWLLEDADKEWAFLRDYPEGSPEFIEHTLKIKWLTDVAANYAEIYEVFCKKKKKNNH
jgi:hypothetical protein|tara:strand:- start:408 stop:701 length:294 start_codon:yes stop_codon:yes gene_type:complete